MSTHDELMTDWYEANEERISEEYVKHLTKTGDIYDAVFWFVGFHGGAESLGDKYRKAKGRWERWLECEYASEMADKAEAEHDDLEG